jgi:hypothetical protein
VAATTGSSGRHRSGSGGSSSRSSNLGSSSGDGEGDELHWSSVMLHSFCLHHVMLQTCFSPATHTDVLHL